MNQIVNLILEEFALGGFLLQVVLMESVKHNMHVLHMSLSHLQEDYNITQID